MDLIMVRAASTAHAERLVVALNDTYSSRINGGPAHSEVELHLDSDTAAKLIELFDTLGRWLSDGKLDACQIGFGERNYTLLAAMDGQVNDPAAFLLERAIQLKTALDSRVLIEQAKGIL